MLTFYNLIIFILTFHTVINLKSDNNSIIVRRKREILIQDQYLWNTPHITYYVRASIDLLFVISALKIISHKTCLKFRNNRAKKDSMLSFEPGEIYETSLGRREPYLHKISVPPRQKNLRKLVRTVLFALGLDFEHNRKDRNNYVLIHRRNIKPQFLKFFDLIYKHLTESYGTNYDFHSVMHFAKYEFSRNRFSPSITALDRRKEFFMGATEHLSFNDRKFLNLKYCRKFPQVPLNCHNHGYPHPLKKYLCKCLPFFNGNNCKLFVRNRVCPGENIFYTQASETGKHIKLGNNCYFLIQSKASKVITLTIRFKNWNVFRRCNINNHLEVRYENDISVAGIPVCPSLKPFKVQTKDGRIIIISKYRNSKPSIRIKYWHVNK